MTWKGPLAGREEVDVEHVRAFATGLRLNPPALVAYFPSCFTDFG